MHLFKHFITITKHRHMVIRYCFKVGIGLQGLGHDLSKYGFTEFINGAKFYTGYCSPNDLERKERGFSYAWMHHKGRNKHHFEYWVDLVDDEYAPVIIPIKYLKESLCDRICASKVYLKDKYQDDSALDYFNKQNTFNKMHILSAKTLKTWLTWVAELGEKNAFKKIKKIKKYEDMIED